MSAVVRLASGALLRARTVVSSNILLGTWTESVQELTTDKGTQNGGTMAPVSEGDHLLISCKTADSLTWVAYSNKELSDVYNDATSQYDQTVTVSGEVVTKFSSSE